MPKIERLEPSKHIPDRYLVFLEGGQLLKVTTSEVLAFQLAAGQDLDPETARALSEAGRLSSAKALGARLVGARPMSRQGLIDKLVEKGEDPLCAQKAADWLEELGALDDGSYAAMLVRHYAAKGYGRRKIESELYRRRVARVYWDDALALLPEPDGQLDALIRQKLRGRAPEGKDLQKLSAYLARRGFSWGDIREALARLGNTLDEC